MSFNFKAIFRFVYNAIRKSLPPYKLTLRRLAWLIYFHLLYPIWQVIIWSGLFLDEVLFPEYREVEIKEPIFIIGNPRSGTTLLHRLLAKDTKNFCVMKTWEILFAPSIVGRKFLKKLVKYDRYLDSFLVRQLRKIDTWVQKQRLGKLHKSPIWEAEEDDNLLFHVWSTIKIWMSTGMLKEARQHTYYDQQIPAKDRKRTFNFYKKCLRRHIYFHNARGKHYLAKNPYFSPMIDTLYEYFPDCKIIYMIRSPLKVVPSCINLVNAYWQEFGDDSQKFDCKEFVLEMTKHWYKYPLERLAARDSSSYTIVRLEDLAKDAKKVVAGVYKKFDLELTDGFANKLTKVANLAKDYKGGRKYSLKKMGLSKKAIVKRYAKIFKRFRFSSNGSM